MKKMNLSFLSKALLLVATMVSFSFLNGCKEDDAPFLSLSAEKLVVGQDAQLLTIDVYTNASLWQAVSDAPWIEVLAGTGKYKGEFQISIERNSTTEERTGHVTVTGGGLSTTLTVVQTPVAADLALSTNSVSFTKAAGQHTVTVYCNNSWTVSSSHPDWCTTSVASGDASHNMFDIMVAANATGKDRVAVVSVTTIANGQGQIKTVSVFQSGSDNILVIAPEEASVNFMTNTVTMTVTANCDWDVTPSVDWLTIGGATSYSGTGNEALTIEVASNETGLERTGTITARSLTPGEQIVRTFTVKQSADEFYLDVLSEPVIVNSTAHNGADAIEVGVSTNVEWSVRSTAATWCTVTKNATDDGAIIEVAANATDAERTATLIFTTTAAGTKIEKTLTVTQTATKNFFEILSVNPLMVEADGTIPGMTTPIVSFNTNADWTVSAQGNTWLTPGANSGTSSDVEVGMTIMANTTPDTRSCILTFTTTTAGNKVTKTITVTQKGLQNNLTVDAPANVELPSAAVAAYPTTPYAIAASGVVTVTSTSPTWLIPTFTTAVGGGTLTFELTENTGATRTATIDITSTLGTNIVRKTITVTQLGADAPFVTPASASIEISHEAAATGTVTVNSNCLSISASTGSNWLTIDPVDQTNLSGDKDGYAPISFSATTANNGSQQRTATIVVEGRSAAGDIIQKEVAVIQKAGASPYIIPLTSSLTVAPAAADPAGTFGVETNMVDPNPLMTAATNVPWLTATVDAAGTTVTLVTTQDNPNTASRTAIVTLTATLNGQTAQKEVTVIQAGSDANFLNVEAPDAINFAAAAPAANPIYEITVPATATVTAVSNSTDWLTVVNADETELEIALTENTGAPRTGTITVRSTMGSNVVSKVITVNQAGSDNAYLIVAGDVEIEAANGSTGVVAVTTNIATATDISVNTGATWLTGTYAAATGITVTATSDNNTAATRVATVTVTGTMNGQTIQKTFKATQLSNAVPNLILSGDVEIAAANGSTGVVDVTTNITTATDISVNTGVSWLTGTYAAATGITVTATSANTAEAARTANVTVTATLNGQTIQKTFKATQVGTPVVPGVINFLTLAAPSTVTIDAATATAFSYGFTAATGTAVDAFSSDASWLTADINGTDLEITPTANTTANTRTATAYITSILDGDQITKSVTVTQLGTGVVLANSLEILTSGPIQTDNTVKLANTAEGMGISFISNSSWKISSPDSWITLPGTTTGAVSTDIQHIYVGVTANASARREGTLLIETTSATGNKVIRAIKIVQSDQPSSTSTGADGHFLTFAAPEQITVTGNNAPVGTFNYFSNDDASVTYYKSVTWLTVNQDNTAKTITIECSGQPGNGETRTGVVAIVSARNGGEIVRTFQVNQSKP